MQFINIHCSANTKTAIKCALKKEQLSARREIDLDTKKRKYYNDPQKKRDAAKEIYNNKKESIKQSKKGKYMVNYASESKVSGKS